MEFPDNSLDDLRYGFRASKYMFKSMFYVSYFHTQNYTPSASVTLTGPFSYDIDLVYPDEDIFGLSMNTKCPGSDPARRSMFPTGPLRSGTLLMPDKIDKRD
jgi:hypothetical protein